MAGKVLEIPDNEIFNRIKNQVLTEDTQNWLYKVYQDSKSLGMVIINHIEMSWAGFNRLVMDKTITLTQPWDGYKLSNIEVIEKSIPNSLMEYLSKIGVGHLVQLPANYKTGVVLAQTYTYYVNDGLFAQTASDPNGTPVASVMVADIYVTMLDGSDDHLRCVIF